MNILRVKSDSMLIAFGAIGGTVAGGLVNFSKTHSFFVNDLKRCRKPFNIELFNDINNFREEGFQSGNNPFFSVIHLAPTLGFALWNICFQRDFSRRGYTTKLARGFKQIIKGVVSPAFHSSIFIFNAFAIREFMKDYIAKSKIDSSGHVLVMGSLMITAFSSFNAVKEHGTSTQLKVYKLILGTIALTDAIWMFNTAANCHSIADVAAGTAVMLLSEGSLQLYKLFALKGIQMTKDTVKKLY